MKLYNVYWIKNDRDSFYVGLTGRFVEKRLKEHNRGHTISTARETNWKLLHHWSGMTYIEASKLERWLHRMPPEGVEHIVKRFPEWCDKLCRCVSALPTTAYEKLRMERDMSHVENI